MSGGGCRRHLIRLDDALERTETHTRTRSTTQREHEETRGTRDGATELSSGAFTQIDQRAGVPRNGPWEKGWLKG